MLLSSKGAYSRDKVAAQCKCGCKKHCRFMGVQSIRRNPDAFACRVCKGEGSSHEKLLYELMDNEELIELYAVESHCITSTVEIDKTSGQTLDVGRHKWDAVTLVPPSLVIEVQGEGHSSKLITKPKNPEYSLAERVHRDDVLAAAAQADGFSILVLYADDSLPRQALATKWAQKLHEAVVHVASGLAPKLFST